MYTHKYMYTYICMYTYMQSEKYRESAQEMANMKADLNAKDTSLQRMETAMQSLSEQVCVGYQSYVFYCIPLCVYL